MTNADSEAGTDVDWVANLLTQQPNPVVAPSQDDAPATDANAGDTHATDAEIDDSETVEPATTDSAAPAAETSETASQDQAAEPDPGDGDDAVAPTPHPAPVVPATPSHGGTESRGDDEQGADDVNAGAKRVGAWMAGGVGVAAVGIVAAFALVGGGPEADPPPPERLAPTEPTVAAAPQTSSAPVEFDQAVPFTASAAGCRGGLPHQSSSAQALSDPSGDSAWVCGRGMPDEQADGQVLYINFTCDPSRPQSACSYMLNSVAITPGWVSDTADAADTWLQHRVVSNLQYNFFNGNELVDIVQQDTGGVHGPATRELPRQILASKVTVIIQHTTRPAADPLPTAGEDDAFPGWGDPLFSPSPDNPEASDPVDASFAVSSMQFFGHEPS